MHTGCCRIYASLTFFFTPLNLYIRQYKEKAKNSYIFLNVPLTLAFTLAVISSWNACPLLLCFLAISNHPLFNFSLITVGVIYISLSTYESISLCPLFLYLIIYHLLLSVSGLKYYSSKWDINSFRIELLLTIHIWTALALVGNVSWGRRYTEKTHSQKMKAKMSTTWGQRFCLTALRKKADIIERLSRLLHFINRHKSKYKRSLSHI